MCVPDTSCENPERLLGREIRTVTYVLEHATMTGLLKPESNYNV